jgi:hypothetical protein
VKKALADHEAEKESKTLTISTASNKCVRDYLEQLKLVMCEEEVSDMGLDDLTISPFEWDDNLTEDQHMVRIVRYVNDLFQICGIVLGRGGYKIYDVHSDKTLLNFEDEKSGKISGGTDIIVGPFGVAQESLAQVSCVAIEIKTAKKVRENGLNSFSSQGTLELIAANYHSNQMTLVIVTDLSTAATAWTLARDDDGELGIVRYADLTLQQMMSMITSHLSRNCVPNARFSLTKAVEKEEYRDKESVQIQKKFKTDHVSGTSLAMEHFHELLELTPSGSRERAQAIQEFFYSQNLPKSNYLDMYI